MLQRLEVATIISPFIKAEANLRSFAQVARARTRARARGGSDSSEEAAAQRWMGNEVKYTASVQIQIQCLY